MPEAPTQNHIILPSRHSEESYFIVDLRSVPAIEVLNESQARVYISGEIYSTCMDDISDLIERWVDARREPQ